MQGMGLVTSWLRWLMLGDQVTSLQMVGDMQVSAGHQPLMLDMLCAGHQPLVGDMQVSAGHQLLVGDTKKKEDIGIEQQLYEIVRGKNFALNCLN